MATKSKTSKASTPNGASRTNGKPANGRSPNGKRANGNGATSTADARRIATEMGSAILVASSLETARHSDDVELIAGAISEHLGLSEGDRADVLAAARLHDIGKASIPRDLLEKPSTLTAAEWKLMRTHTIIGADILSSVRELKGIARLVRHSHERWDGNGYPDGLAGNQIPLGSRIIFCADAFHAIRSDRPYRDGIPAAQARVEVRRCAGTQFDPEIVAAFEQVIHDLRLAPKAGRRVKRSSRLSALLLCLAIGGGGSAAAVTNLLGEPDAGAAQAPPVTLDCGSLYCHSLYVPAGAGIAGATGLPDGISGPGGPLASAPGKSLTGDRGGILGGSGSIGGGSSVSLGKEKPPHAGGGQGTSGGGSQEAVKPPKPAKRAGDKNPDANGNGWAKGHDKNKVDEPAGPKPDALALPGLPKLPGAANGNDKPPKL